MGVVWKGAGVTSGSSGAIWGSSGRSGHRWNIFPENSSARAARGCRKRGPPAPRIQTLMVLGADEGLRLIEQLENVEALVLVDSPAGPQERVSPSLSLHRIKR